MKPTGTFYFFAYKNIYHLKGNYSKDFIEKD